MKAEVAAVNCETYGQTQVQHAVDRAMTLLGGISRFVRPGNRVLLKVNLLAPTPPEAAITTHPEVVRAVVRQVRAAGGVPLVGDCCAFEGPPSRGRFLSACRKSGILQVCEEEGFEPLQLSAETVEVQNPEGRAFRRLPLAKAVLEADVVVNLPKLKTHALTRITGGVKNLFGCLPGLHKGQMHFRAQDPESFAQMLVDLLVAVRPRLTVMDAVVGMEGNGPRNGRPRSVGAVLAGVDPVALDTVACSIVGIPPWSVPTLRLAGEQGVGTADLAAIEILGDPIEALRVAPFALPSSSGRQWAGLLGKALKGQMVAKPSFDADSCRGCWACVDACPAGAITRDTNKPMLDDGKCIHCYCCQEMCPHDAIQLRRPALSRLLSR